MRKTVILLILTMSICMLSANTIMYANNWGEDGITKLQSSTMGISMNFSMSTMDMDIVDINGDEMIQLSIPGVILPNDEGAPNLPGVGRWIAVPEGSDVSVRIVSTRTEIYKNVEIAPAPNIPADMPGTKLVYVKDMSIYSSDEYYPKSPVVISDMQYMRGTEARVIGITPFQYNPVTKELIVYKDMEIEITYSGGRGFNDNKYRNRFWEPILQSNLLNYEDLPYVDFNDKTRYTGYGWEYIIIIPDDAEFEAWADTIKNWRMSQGIKTKVVHLSEIGGNTTTAIENFTDSAYTNWAVPPIAILLLSDYQSTGKAYGITSPTISHPYSGSMITDNIYADVDGTDSLPEIVFARITAHDGTQLDTMISKFLDYERNPVMDGGFYQNPLIACGYQTERWFQLCAEIVYGFYTNELSKTPHREYQVYLGSPSQGSSWSTATNTSQVVNYFGSAGLGYITDTIPAGIDWYGGTASGISNAINTGTFLLLHRDHGGETGWGEPGYYNSSLSSLNNTMLPFVLSINCLTGKFNYGSECFVERFHRMEGGALGVIGATEVSYSFVNDAFIFGLYDNMWHEFDPGYPQSTMWGYEYLRPGFANVSGKYYLAASSFPYNTSSKTITYNLFHMHGDPFITLNSEIPDSMGLTHLAAVPIGHSIITIQVTDNATTLPLDSARVALCSAQDSTIWLRGWTDAAGEIDFEFDASLVGDTLNIVALKQNYIMQTGKVLVVSGMSVTIDPDTIDAEITTAVLVTVMDSSGLNPEDSIEVHIYGFGVDETDTTNSSGECLLSINSPYGQILHADGRKINESYDSFEDTIWVLNASMFSSKDIDAYCQAIGLTGGLMTGMEGNIYGIASVTGLTLYLNGCGVDTNAYSAGDSVDIAVTPTQNGNILSTLCRPGYYVYQEYVNVSSHENIMELYVYENASGDPIENAAVQLYILGSDTASVSPVFSGQTNASGIVISDSLACNDYDRYVTCFGYLPIMDTVRIMYNGTYDSLGMDNTVSTVVYGTVTESNSGNPLSGTINVYRTDNNELYATDNSDSLSGGTYSITLPQFSYKFITSSYQHKLKDTTISLSVDSLELNFVLDTTMGMILVVDNPYNSKSIISKNKDDIPSGGTKAAYASADSFYSWLVNAGYDVDSVSSTATAAADWDDYDFIIWSCGYNDEALQDGTQRSEIKAYIDAGGKIVFEGGDLIDEMSFEDMDLLNNYFHVQGDNGDASGALVCDYASHPIVTTPYMLLDTMELNYSNSTYYDQDVANPNAELMKIYGTETYPNYIGLGIYDPTLPIESGQTVIYAFNVADLADQANAKNLVINTAEYLLALEPEPNDTLYGIVNVDGSSDNSDVVIEAIHQTLALSYYDTTDVDGNYRMSLYGGDYTVYASRSGCTDSLVNATVSGNTYVNFTIYPYDTIISYTFEPDSDAVASSGCWEWGTPSTGPGSAFSLPNLWATYLDANYPANNSSQLTLPTIDLSGVNTPLLSFRHWLYIEPTYDGGNIKISVDGGSYSILSNVSPAYNQTTNSLNAGIPNEQAWGGSVGWREVTADLSAYAGSNISLRFDFGSDASVQYAGWYIDDIVIYETNGMTGVEIMGIPDMFSASANRINTNNNIIIQFGLPIEADVEIKMIDCTGRVVNNSEDYYKAGYHNKSINSTEIPQGVYFITISNGTDYITSKVILMK